MIAVVVALLLRAAAVVALAGGWSLFHEWAVFRRLHDPSVKVTSAALAVAAAADVVGAVTA